MSIYSVPTVKIRNPWGPGYMIVNRSDLQPGQELWAGEVPGAAVLDSVPGPPVSENAPTASPETEEGHSWDDPPDGQPPLEAMTVRELRALAETLGARRLPAVVRKIVLIEWIKGAQKSP